MIQVYFAPNNIQVATPKFLDYLEGLSKERRERVNAISHEQGKVERLVSSVLLEENLMDCGILGPYHYKLSKRGKPYIVEKDGKQCEKVDISISHTKELSAAAVLLAKQKDESMDDFVLANKCDHAYDNKGKKVGVGVDVESIGRYKKKIVQRYFSEEEQSYFIKIEEEIRKYQGTNRQLALEEEKQVMFTKLWTGKEAIAKCLDQPLTFVCKDYNVLKPSKISLTYHRYEQHILCCASIYEDEVSFCYHALD